MSNLRKADDIVLTYTSTQELQVLIDRLDSRYNRTLTEETMAINTIL